jgi:alkanesulfonate monooxygenase SsuD/methylene tetrahydromethanopterin reductase-like flavin-dependent oxidoreductase (luciferase family)
MRFALMTEPQQGLTYDEILALARTAEAAGLEAFLRCELYGSLAGAEDGPNTDAWATLAGLARDTSTIRIGSLVSPVTFRVPGSFAKVVTTVDEMSGGRGEVGVGAGWNDEEHSELGCPFPPLRERYDQLEESLAIIHGLWTEPDGWNYPGQHWQLRRSHLRPRPTFSGERHPHLILGGEGGPRLARLVATYADEFNRTSASPDNVRGAYARVRAACEAADRDPDSVVLSAMVGVLVADSESEMRDRVDRQLAFFGSGGGSADEWLAERRDRWIMGTPEQAGRRIAEFAAAGVQRIMLQDFLPHDLEMVALLGRIAAG